MATQAMANRSIAEGGAMRWHRRLGVASSSLDKSNLYTRWNLPISPLSRQSHFHSVLCMNGRRVKYRHGDISLFHQKRDFSAAQNDSLRTLLNEIIDDAYVFVPRRFFDFSQAKLIINDAVDNFSFIVRWNQHLQLEFLRQPPSVKILLHCEFRPEQANSVQVL